MEQHKLSQLAIEQALNQVPMGTMVSNQNDMIILINNEFINFFNLKDKSEDLIGIHIDEIVSKVGSNFRKTFDFAKFLNDCSKGMEEKNFNFRILDDKTVVIIYRPLFSGKKFVGNAWAFRFSTPDEESNFKLYKKQQLRYKKESVERMLIHELKNYLCSIDTSLSLIEIISSNHSITNSTSKYYSDIEEQFPKIIQNVTKLKILAG